MAELEKAKRIKNFKEVELGLTEKQAIREANRCLVCGCSAAFDCRLRDMMDEFQVDWRSQPSKKIHFQQVAAVDVHPNIAVDPNKCIRCERCYTACAMFQCSNAIDFKDWPQFNENCVDCGLCVDLCPTGALLVKENGRPVDRLDWRITTTHCVHCGCGCELKLEVRGDRLVWISDCSYMPPSWASTCQKGRFHIYDPVWHGERVLKPQVRQDTGNLHAVAWKTAIGKVHNSFRAIQEQHGANALGALASPKATNEALYLLQKWMRAGFKSHGVDFPNRALLEKIWEMGREYNGRKGMVQEMGALECVGAIFVCGDDAEETAPVVATMIRRAARTRQVPVWQLSSQPNALTPFASIAVHAPADKWQEILEGLAAHVARARQLPESAVPQTGLLSADIPADQWEALKQAVAGAPSVAFVFPETLLGTEETAGAVGAFIKLASVGGHLVGQAGAGLYPLTAEINASGALLMGVSPNRLPGFAPASDVESLTKVGTEWGVSDLPKDPWPALEDALKAGQIKGLFVQDAASLWAKDAEKWKALLSGVEYLVLQETVPSPAMDLASVVLPAVAFGEQSGTVINQEHRLLNLDQALPPREKSLADWEILTQIMAAQGISSPRNMEAIHEEMSRVVPELAGFAWEEGIKNRVRLG
jgi:formate dehydrogenase major subunit